MLFFINNSWKTAVEHLVDLSIKGTAQLYVYSFQLHLEVYPYGLIKSIKV